MPTYLELLAQKRVLDARIEEARAEAAADALAAARAAIAEFGFTPEDLFGKGTKKNGVGIKGAVRGTRKPRAAEAGEERAGGETLDLFAPVDTAR
jgi:DNA-binding protein H-NS